MEHSEASDTMASARYLLGEMTEEERNAFEEHFFGCSECARDIRDGSTMMDSIRAEKAIAEPRKTVRAVPWVIAAAASFAAAFFGFVTFEMHQPRILPAYSLLMMGTRGAAPTVITNPSKPFALFIDIPPQPPFPNYRIEIRDSANRPRVSLPVNADEARETITVYVPPNRLQSGEYTVVIVGGSSSTVSTAPLRVR